MLKKRILSCQSLWIMLEYHLSRCSRLLVVWWYSIITSYDPRRFPTKAWYLSRFSQKYFSLLPKVFFFFFKKRWWYHSCNLFTYLMHHLLAFFSLIMLSLSFDQLYIIRCLHSLWSPKCMLGGCKLILTAASICATVSHLSDVHC